MHDHLHADAEVDAIADLPLFRGMSEAVLASCVAAGRRAHRSVGETIHDPAEESPPCVFAVLRGGVDVLSDAGSAWITIAHVGPGGLIGQFAALDGKHDASLLRARFDTSLLVFQREVFCQFIETHPKAAMNLLRELTGIVRDMNRRLTALKGLHTDVDRIRADLWRFAI